jgi:hypothetical protein
MKKTVCFIASLLCAAVIFSVGFTADDSHASDNSKIAVAYSGNIFGYFESCG